MFSTIHRHGELLERNWLRRMRIHREAIVGEAKRRVPKNKDAKNIAERLKTWEEEYFRFIEAGIPPTNNLGEQTIRCIVIDRKITQGTRSEWGNRWMERIWSILSTCKQQDVNVMSFLNSCVESYIYGHTPPSLFRN